MAYFTTDFEELMRRIRDGLRSNDIEMVLEAFEAVSRFHPKRPVEQSICESIATIAANKRQYLLAERALDNIVDRVASFDESTPPELLSAMLKLAILRSRYLQRPATALPLVSLLSKVYPQGMEFICPELSRIERIFSLRVVEGNPPDALQTVLMSSRDSINTQEFGDAMAQLTGVHKFEFVRRMHPRSGRLLTGISGAERAEMVLDKAREMGVPAFYIADQALVQIRLKTKEFRAIALKDDGVEISLGIEKPILVPYGEISLFDAGRVQMIETVEEERKTRPMVTRMLMSEAGSYKRFAPSPEPRKREIERVYTFISLYTHGDDFVYMGNLDQITIARPYNYTGTVVKSKEEWLAENLLQLLPNAFFGYGAHLLAYDGMAGNWGEQQFKTPPEYADYIDWMVLLLRLGLL